MAAMVEKMLPEITGDRRHGQVTLNTSFDRLMKAVSVFFPLLVSGTLFLGEVAGETEKVFCFPPANYSTPQATYLNAVCKNRPFADQIWISLFPYSVPLIGLAMYIPHFLWEVSVGTKLKSQVTFISKQIENAFSRLRKLVELQVAIDNEEHLSDAQKEENKKALVARQQMKDSLFVLRKFLNELTLSTKLSKRKKTKFVALVILAALAILYLMWFGIRGFLKIEDNSFVCNVNGQNFTCEISGVTHLYAGSILLSIPFWFSMPLPIIFAFKTRHDDQRFLSKLYKKLDVLTNTVFGTAQDSGSGASNEKTVPKTGHMHEEIELQTINDKDKDNEGTGSKTIAKSSVFSDFAIIGRLCAENRHLIPSLHMIMNMDQESLKNVQTVLSTDIGRSRVDTRR